jgi:Tfp pilus assembly PilM family ATPase
MAKGSIGIYISAKYVDIAELGGSLYAPQLTNFIREEIPPEAYPKVQPEEIQLTPPQNHHDNIVAALRKGLSKLKAKPEGVYSVLASSDSIIRYFDIPPLPKSEQAQAIKFEAKKYIPFKIDEIVSDFKTLSMPGPKKTIAVFFMAAAKDKINSQVDIFKRAETEVVGIDIVPYTLMRMLLLGKKIHAKDNVAILDGHAFLKPGSGDTR